MDDPGTVKLELELDRRTEPIAGRLHQLDGTVAEFVGWLELTQVLESVRAASEGRLDAGGRAAP
jgi:hypothetical protein